MTNQKPQESGLNLRHVEITPKEQETLDWCRLALTEEQIVECEEDATEIAGIELHREEAAELMVKLLADILIRNVRAEQTGRTNSSPRKKSAIEYQSQKVNAEGPGQEL